MSRNVAAKLAAGKKLDKDEIRYAHDRGINLGDDYPTPQIITDGASVPLPVVQTGPAFEGPPGEAGHDPREFLADFAKDDLLKLAEKRGLDVPASIKKDDLIEAIVSGGTSEQSDSDEEDEDEAGDGDSE